MFNFGLKSRPSTEDAARRAYILKHLVGISILMPPPEAREVLMGQWSPSEVAEFNSKIDHTVAQIVGKLRSSGVWTSVTPSERGLFETKFSQWTDVQRMNASWRSEAVHVLLWALGIVDGIGSYDTNSSPDELANVNSDFNQFLHRTKLRPVTEIDQARDNAESWHWRSRTRELMEDGAAFPTDEQMCAAGVNGFSDLVRMVAEHAAQDLSIPPAIGGDFPAFGKPYAELTEEEWSTVRSITMERHFALNWLCGYARRNRWDDTPTDT